MDCRRVALRRTVGVHGALSQWSPSFATGMGLLYRETVDDDEASLTLVNFVDHSNALLEWKQHHHIPLFQSWHLNWSPLYKHLFSLAKLEEEQTWLYFIDLHKADEYNGCTVVHCRYCNLHWLFSEKARFSVVPSCSREKEPPLELERLMHQPIHLKNSKHPSIPLPWRIQTFLKVVGNDKAFSLKMPSYFLHHQLIFYPDIKVQCMQEESQSAVLSQFSIQVL